MLDSAQVAHRKQSPVFVAVRVHVLVRRNVGVPCARVGTPFGHCRSSSRRAMWHQSWLAQCNETTMSRLALAGNNLRSTYGTVQYLPRTRHDRGPQADVDGGCRGSCVVEQRAF